MQTEGVLERFQEFSRKRVTGDANVRIRDHVAVHLKREPVVRTIDKVLFTAGVVWVVSTEYVLLCSENFASWFLFSIGPLMVYRIVTYRKSGLIYFCFDFCYFVNLLCFFEIIFQFGLFEVVFSLANGPLVFAIVVWRNSFIFHSLDHVTSTMLHALAPLWTFTERDHREPKYLPAVAAYLVWQVAYFCITECYDIGDQLTSLKWMVKERGFMYRLCKRVLISLRLMHPQEEFDSSTWRTKITFWTAQFVYTLLTLLPVKLMWASRRVHTCVLAAVYLTAIYNGASYYIEVFSRRYNLKFDS